MMDFINKMTKGQKIASVLGILLVFLLILAIILTSCNQKPAEPVMNPDIAASESVEPATAAPSGPVDASWFDDAVFVGDSITLKLMYYCDSHPESMSKVQFFCAGSLGWGNALFDLDDPNQVHPVYKGESVQAEYCAEKTGAKKVFIMLGMNDIGLYGVDGTKEHVEELIGRIKSHTPDVTFYIQSTTPILLGKEVESAGLTNENIRIFDEWLEGYCAEKGYQYFDIYSQLCDEDGYLKAEYCGDPDAMGIHFTDQACALWIDYLKNNVK